MKRIPGPSLVLPGRGPAWGLTIPMARIAPPCHGLEGNYPAWRGQTGLDAVEVLWGASLLAALVAVPAAMASGHAIDLYRVWGPPEWAILVSALAHTLACTGYVWLVGRAGAVLAAQVACIVTVAGVVRAMLRLGERHAATVWVALAVMLGGLALVQPRARRARPCPPWRLSMTLEPVMVMHHDARALPYPRKMPPS